MFVISRSSQKKADTPLDFSKVKRDLMTTGSNQKSLLLQALRWVSVNFLYWISF